MNSGNNHNRNNNSFLNSFRKKTNNHSNNDHRHHPNGNGGRNNVSEQQQQQLVGTERMAVLAIQRNRQLYQYPIHAEFSHKIEYTLLYNMMNYPNIYPVSVIYEMILVEDFKPYIYINYNNQNSSSGNDYNNTNTATCPPCSYAQLTAILALAADKWPPPPSSSSTNTTMSTTTTTTPLHTNTNDSRHRNSSDSWRINDDRGRNRFSDNDVANSDNDDNNDDDDEYEQSVRQRKQQQQQMDSSSASSSSSQQQPPPAGGIHIVQTLCQRLVQCIVRHCEDYQLDRATEINEFFKPFQKVTTDRATKSTVMSVLPAYMGLTATILSGGNPIPFYIGYAVSINAMAQQDHNLQNFQDVAATTSRMSNIETTNLLHDTDYDVDYDNDDDDDKK